MGIRNPAVQAPDEVSASIRICYPIVTKLLEGDFDYDYECEVNQVKAMVDIRNDRRKKEKERKNELIGNLPPLKQCSI